MGRGVDFLVLVGRGGGPGQLFCCDVFTVQHSFI